jgi:hypothetical protein
LMRALMPMHWRGFYRLLDGDGIGSHSVIGGPITIAISIAIFCAVGHGHDQGVAGVRGHRYA